MVRDDGYSIRLAFGVATLVIVLSGCGGMNSGTATDAASAEEQARAAALDGLTTASRSLLQQSQVQQETGDYAQAAASLERAIRIDPSHAMLWVELGRVRLIEGDDKQAEQIGRKAQSLAAEDPYRESESLQLVIDSLRSQGRYIEARELAFGDY
jgi:cytochrome c-type biogenesis protein CcmH/NrfG